jgi:hypothetical protein
MFDQNNHRWEKKSNGSRSILKIKRKIVALFLIMLLTDAASASGYRCTVNDTATADNGRMSAPS